MARKQARFGQPAVYNASAPTLTDGDDSALNVDVNGNLIIVSPGGGSAEQVQGNVASGATDTGNPVKVGGVYNSSGPSLTNGQRGDLQLDGSAVLKVILPYTGASSSAIQGTSASNAAAVGNPVMVGGKYNATPQTFDDGDVANLQGDVNGNLNVNQATALAGEDLANNVLKVEQRFSYLNIAAGQATTTVKSGAGFLHSITFNSAATATNTTTVYDNTAASGTVIAIPAATTATVPTTLTYDVSFATGLTIITATANGSNMTVSYR